ncbi:hypothetical protein N7465_006202 [Penicillium sp. CMV-2018d]|nr:hypothetical protein N7465_006202 [Penicillium sp. CMV-2018d]
MMLTAEFHAGSLADDVANNDNLGLLAAALSPPDDGWTPENPKPKMPGPPKTNVTRYATETDKAFVLALCYFRDQIHLIVQFPICSIPGLSAFGLASRYMGSGLVVAALVGSVLRNKNDGAKGLIP